MADEDMKISDRPEAPSCSVTRHSSPAASSNVLPGRAGTRREYANPVSTIPRNRLPLNRMRYAMNAFWAES
jgi:hypothetical protein